jgi:hypothetical protein
MKQHNFRIVYLENQYLYLSSWNTQHLRLGIPIPELKSDLIYSVDLFDYDYELEDYDKWVYDNWLKIYKSAFGNRIIESKVRCYMTQCPDCRYHERKVEGKYPLMKMRFDRIGMLKCPNCGYTCIIRKKDVMKKDN